MSGLDRLPSEAEVGSLTCDYIPSCISSCSLYPDNIDMVKSYVVQNKCLVGFDMQTLHFVENYLYGDGFENNINSINEMCGDIISWKVSAKELLSSGTPLVSPPFTLKHCNHNFFVSIAEPLPDNDEFMIIIDDGTDGAGFAIYVDCLLSDKSVVKSKMEIGIELRVGGELIGPFNAQNFDFEHLDISEQSNRVFKGILPKFIKHKITHTDPLEVIVFLNHIFDEYEEIFDEIRFDYISSKSIVPAVSECELVLTPTMPQLMASSFCDNQVYCGGLKCVFARGDVLWSFARVMDQVELSDLFVTVFILYKGETDYKFLCCKKEKRMGMDADKNMMRIPIKSQCEGDFDKLKFKIMLCNVNRFGRHINRHNGFELGAYESSTNENLVFTKVVDERDIVSHFKMTKMSFSWTVFGVFIDQIKVVLKHKNALKDDRFTNLVGIDFDAKSFGGAVTLKISDIYEGSNFVHQDDQNHDECHTTCEFDVGSGPFVTCGSRSFKFVVILYNPS